MVDFEQKERYDYEDLLRITQLLRGEDGCPWDREQDHKSIRKNFVEEVYEAVEAIETDDAELLTEELGDVLFQVVFHAQIASEAQRFAMADVVDGICKKLVQRHPHVFGQVTVADSGEVLKNWDAIKMKTKEQKTQTQAMQSISTFLPALMRAEKIQQKAAKVGFDWDEIEPVYQKVQEELAEVREAAQEQNMAHLEEEVGDLLFAAVNLSRFLGVDAELSLKKTCEKFIKRFNYIENHANLVYNRDMQDLSLEEMDLLWNESKKAENK
ncbi:MAG: nucleoside triphosphate pyrophosphohydrolase [Eubacteriales bacterium]|jgi:tetrapyrrole methylase family protein/MazG family protein